MRLLTWTSGREKTQHIDFDGSRDHQINPSAVDACRRRRHLVPMLGAKQGIEMQPFSHPFAKSVRFRWVSNPNGGFMIQAMVIVPNVPSNPTQSDFDQSKIDQLGAAALKYAEATRRSFLIEIVEF